MVWDNVIYDDNSKGIVSVLKILFEQSRFQNLNEPNYNIYDPCIFIFWLILITSLLSV